MLSDDDLNKIIVAQWGADACLPAHRTFARAVEAAHGIKQPGSEGMLTREQVDACWNGNTPEGYGKSRYDIARAIEALVRAECAPQWQPIETAPKDGRTILLGGFNLLNKWRTMRGQWVDQDYIDNYWEDPDAGEPGWYETCVEGDVPNMWLIEPTRWMPLPAEPGITAPQVEQQ